MMVKVDVKPTRIVIDKAKVKEYMDRLGVASFRALAQRVEQSGEDAFSERTLYNILGSDSWHSKMLYTLADVLDCSPLDLLTAMIDADQGKAVAPVEIDRILQPL